jgi:hypothetical protein
MRTELARGEGRALLGHSKVTVGEGFGVGFPVPMFKRWIDRIEF